jgi:molecular chaperone HtpG
LLPYPIRVSLGKRSEVVNERGAPWRQEFRSEKERSRSLLNFGREAFGVEFFDAIPLRTRAGKIDGVAFVLPYEANVSGKRTHRVYLKNMLLSESAENLLPEWAFFVKAIVNANDLRPTASRETFYEDEKLEAARKELGDSLRAYLVKLAEKQPEKLEQFIDLHYRALKALAVEDDEFFGLIIDYLPFETTLGRTAMGAYRAEQNAILFTSTVDQFRQIARIAAAQGRCVINAGYSFDLDLLTKAAELFDLRLQEIEASEIAESFDELTLPEQEATHLLLTVAESALKRFKCEPDVRKFKPSEVPALFSTSKDGRFLRSLEQSRDVANPMWGGILDQLGKREARGAVQSQICFNLSNPLVGRLTGLANRTLMRRAVEMLYVQALLLGHQPLSAKEMALLNEGLLALIDIGVSAGESDA